jgi:hypothetical protein
MAKVPRNEVVGGYTGFTMSVRLSVQLLTGEERRIPFFFDDFHFCHSRVIGLKNIFVSLNTVIIKY